MDYCEGMMIVERSVKSGTKSDFKLVPFHVVFFVCVFVWLVYIADDYHIPLFTLCTPFIFPSQLSVYCK